MRQNQLKRRYKPKMPADAHSYAYPAPILYGQSASPRRLASEPKRRRGWIRAIGLVGAVLLLSLYWEEIASAFHSSPQAAFSAAATLPEESEFELPSLDRRKGATIRHRVKKGETLSTIIRGYGLGWDAVQEVADALKNSVEDKRAAKLFPGQYLDFVLEPERGITGLSLSVDVGSYYTGRRNPETGKFEIKFVELPRKTIERSAHGVISSSFAAAAADVGVSYDVVDDLVDLYGSKVIFHRDFRKGDRFTLVYEQNELSDGTVVQSGPLSAALLSVNGSEIAAVRYIGSDGKARYFDQSGEALGNTFLRYPVRFSRISSVYSGSRLHPVTKRRTPHLGVDFAAPTGTPVRAAADGKVLFAGWKGPNGKMIKIQHGTRYQTAYCHLSRISKGIKRNSRVTRGQVIGAVGTTGRSTGPHLHYAFYDRGRYVDPLKVKLPRAEQLTKGTRIPKDYLAKALGTLQHYHAEKLRSQSGRSS